MRLPLSLRTYTYLWMRQRRHAYGRVYVFDRGDNIRSLK